MRMRKKAWAQPFLDAHPEFVIQNPEVWHGKWKELMPCEKLHVEIGCGKGDYFIGMAKQFPQDAFVAIERDSNVGAVAAKKALGDLSSNTRMVVADASNIEHWFGDKEVDIIHLNFSDPWPKSSHSKRRLSHGNFVSQYNRMLADDGEIQMKTDNQKLFEFSLMEFSRLNWLLVDVSVDYRRTEQPDVMTEYESRFVSLNQPIYRLVVRKKENK